MSPLEQLNEDLIQQLKAYLDPVAHLPQIRIGHARKKGQGRLRSYYPLHGIEVRVLGFKYSRHQTYKLLASKGVVTPEAIKHLAKKVIARINYVASQESSGKEAYQQALERQKTNAALREALQLELKAMGLHDARVEFGEDLNLKALHFSDEDATRALEALRSVLKP